MNKKGILCILLCLALAFTFAACNGGNSDENSDPKEKEIALADFYKLINLEEGGYWDCPGQFQSDRILFETNAGEYHMTFIQTHTETSNEVKEYIIDKVTKNEDTGNLTVYAKDHAGNELVCKILMDSYGDDIIKTLSFDGKVTDAEYMFHRPSASFQVWKLLRDGDNANYAPTVEIHEDGRFIFTENVFEGMGFFYGAAELKGNGYVLHVETADKMEGFAGADVKEIVLVWGDNNSLVSQTTICYTNAGDVFQYQY